MHSKPTDHSYPTAFRILKGPHVGEITLYLGPFGIEATPYCYVSADGKTFMHSVAPEPDPWWEQIEWS